MITSRKNSHLKTIRQLRRSKGGGRHALLEGPHLIAEAIETRCELHSLLASPDFLASSAGRKLQPVLPFRPIEVAPKLLAEVTDSDSPRGIIGVATLRRSSVTDLPLLADAIFVYAEGLQDPGNLGALARVAEASGSAGLCLGSGSVHPNHPRALRASAGSLLRLPLSVATTPAELDSHLTPLSPRWIALSPHGGTDLFEAQLAGSLILALGTEGRGLSDEARSRCDLALTIPLRAPVESLNAAVAAAIALFEISRRRRTS